MKMPKVSVNQVLDYYRSKNGQITCKAIANHFDIDESTVWRKLKSHRKDKLRFSLKAVSETGDCEGKLGQPFLVAAGGGRTSEANWLNRVRSLGLMALGLKRQHVQKLIGVQAETIREWVLELAPRQQCNEFFNGAEVARIKFALEDKYEMGEDFFERLTFMDARLDKADFLKSVFRHMEPSLNHAGKLIRRITGNRTSVERGRLLIYKESCVVLQLKWSPAAGQFRADSRRL
jgi:transposase